LSHKTDYLIAFLDVVIFQRVFDGIVDEVVSSDEGRDFEGHDTTRGVELTNDIGRHAKVKYLIPESQDVLLWPVFGN
jgi:hypothetical protein